MEYTRQFSSGTVLYRFGDAKEALPALAGTSRMVFLTDETVFRLHRAFFQDADVIVLPEGEKQKRLKTIGMITERLIELGADRSTMLVGVGGGVLTDITGLAASLFMRGLAVGYIPTTLLAMVDAAIGGKNGVNYDSFKNVLGTIRQPDFILFDLQFLQTLPALQWNNGMAEVIKYGCLFDKFLFEKVTEEAPETLCKNAVLLSEVIDQCVSWKNKIVALDEFERHERKLLNFGHTVGHAVENLYELPHGYAVAVGMLVASKLSEEISGLAPAETQALGRALQAWHLPVSFRFNVDEVMTQIKMDKKRRDDSIDFIVLEAIGKSRIERIGLDRLRKTLTLFSDEHKD